MATVGLTPRIPDHRNKIGRILGTISENAVASRGGGMLSVLVHQKKSGQTRPGKGFFQLARDLGFKWDDDDAFVSEQTDKVLAQARKTRA